jgi:hypothetical protein
MNKEAKEQESSDGHEMRPEYDFSKGVRAKYAARFREGSNVVILDPDVAEAFPSSESVNEALRKVAGLDG